VSWPNSRFYIALERESLSQLSDWYEMDLSTVGTLSKLVFLRRCRRWSGEHDVC